ncbi:MAG: hypothetical protein ABI444_00480 [Candidatus Kapaibacterium sp.]|jgi:hypothetical protein
MYGIYDKSGAIKAREVKLAGKVLSQLSAKCSKMSPGWYFTAKQYLRDGHEGVTQQYTYEPGDRFVLLNLAKSPDWDELYELVEGWAYTQPGWDWTVFKLHVRALFPSNSEPIAPSLDIESDPLPDIVPDPESAHVIDLVEYFYVSHVDWNRQRSPALIFPAAQEYFSQNLPT